MKTRMEKNYLQIRAVLYSASDDEVTLEGYGNYSVQVTDGDIYHSTMNSLQEEGFDFFISEGHLVITK